MCIRGQTRGLFVASHLSEARPGIASLASMVVKTGETHTWFDPNFSLPQSRNFPQKLLGGHVTPVPGGWANRNRKVAKPYGVTSPPAIILSLTRPEDHHIGKFQGLLRAWSSRVPTARVLLHHAIVFFNVVIGVTFAIVWDNGLERLSLRGRRADYY